MLQIEIYDLPLRLAKILTMSSGWDVPNGTMVKPFTMFGMLYLLASAAEPSTSQSAPLISKTNPMTNININFKKGPSDRPTEPTGAFALETFTADYM